jgi:hypothetical protein
MICKKKTINLLRYAGQNKPISNFDERETTPRKLKKQNEDLTER